MTRGKKRRRDPDAVFLDAVGRYLKRHGFVALVAGPCQVIEPSPLYSGPAHLGRHELVIHFTGGKAKEKHDQ